MPTGLKLEYSMLIDILEKVDFFLLHCKTRGKTKGHLGCSWRWVRVLIFLPSRVVARHAPAPNKITRTVEGRRAYVAAVRQSERALVLQVTHTCFRSGALRQRQQGPTDFDLWVAPVTPRGFSPGDPSTSGEASTRRRGRCASIEGKRRSALAVATATATATEPQP